MKENPKVIYTPKEIKPNYNFEEVDIFLRVKGRLPDQKGDGLTQKILDEYCQKFEEGKLTEGVVPLRHMYNLIKNKKIKINE